LNVDEVHFMYIRIKKKERRRKALNDIYGF